MKFHMLSSIFFRISYLILISIFILSCNNDDAPTPKFALQFDGVDGHVIFKNSEGLNPTNAITVSMWLFLSKSIDCDENDNWRGLLFKGVPGDPNPGYNIVINEDAALSWTVSTSGGNVNYGTGEGLPIGDWIFLTFVYDGLTSEAKIYFNGELDTSGGYGSFGAGEIISNTGDLRLNTYTDTECPSSLFSGGNFPGTIDELRIWNIALTQGQIQENMNQVLLGNETGLVSYWRFDEGSDLTVFDLISNNDGILQEDGVTWVLFTAPVSYR